MRETITTELLRRLQHAPPTAVLDIYDTKVPRLVLRARPTGKHSYRIALGRGRWYTLGGTDLIRSPAIARDEAQKRLGEYASGADPRIVKRGKRQLTVDSYLTQVYGPWLGTHRRSGAETLARLQSLFSSTFGALKLSELSAWHVERWRSERLKKGRKPATVNRDLAALRGLLSRAVDWGHLSSHPLARVKSLAEDKTGRLRFLTSAEDIRLRAALEARDDERRARRERTNAWRRERGYAEWAPHGVYSDHLTPLVCLALQTGLRFGEFTGLRWRDVDLDRRTIAVVAEHAKSGKTRRVPLNDEAVRVLEAWRRPSCDEAAFVFPGPDGAQLVDVKTAWAAVMKKAQITGFRFHDLRHTFASRLVMAGVDLNTVRELLGHADLKMTLRYAHLAPEHTAAAVAKLAITTHIHK
jgi:integrase